MSTLLNIFYGNGYSLPLPSIVKSKPMDNIPREAPVRNIRVDRIRVKFCRIGIFEQTIHEEVVSFLPDCIWATDIVSDWETFPLLGIIKQKTYKSVLQVRLNWTC